MTSWSGKIVLLLVLVVMPLQGVAATLTYLFCHGDGKAHVMHSPSNADHSAHQGGPQDEGGTSSYVAYHPCCNHIVSAPLVVTLPAALPDFPVRVLAPDPLHNLFVPEQPQRPPLA